MTDQKVNPLVGETLVTLAQAAEDFGGITIPVSTMRDYVYTNTTKPR
jgi:hypothetical protein